MKQRDDDPFRFDVEDKETVEVKIIRSIGIADLVNYTLNGSDTTPGPLPKNSPVIFTVNKRSKLGVMCTFTDNTGGSFTVRVSGDKGGSFTDSVTRDEGESFKTRLYTFFKTS
jgi:hypothetical protein